MGASMNAKVVVLLGALSAALFSTAATIARSQTTHAYALVGGGNSEVDFIDLASRQETTAGDKVVWILTVSDPTAGKTSHSFIQYQIDCSTWQAKIRYGASYAPNGVVIDSGSGDGSIEPVIPGSLGDTVANYLCKGIDPFPTIPTLPDTNLAIASAQNYIAEQTKKSAQSAPPEPKSLPAKPIVTGDRGI